MEFGYDLVADREHVLNAHDSIFDQTKVEGFVDYRDKGFSIKESIMYQLDKNDYRDYISTWESYLPLYRNLQPSGINEYDALLYNNIFDDKYLFSIVFGKYVDVPKTYGLIYDGKYVEVDKDFSLDQLFDSILQTNGCVIKYRAGANGFGVKVFVAQKEGLMSNNILVSKEDLMNYIEKCKFGIIQERVVQGAFANSLFPESINTCRIISVRKKGDIEHKIVAAGQRIGTSTSAPTDNFAQGGGMAIIDIETGMLGDIVIGNSKDNTVNIVRSDYHPDTGALIAGKTIPMWKTIKSTIIDLTKKLPFFVYAAWDVALLDNGIKVIEINKKSSLDVFQIHGGMRKGILGDTYRENGWLEE